MRPLRELTLIDLLDSGAAQISLIGCPSLI